VGERIEGRLEFRGPSATGGYYRNPEQTRRLFHGDWLDSGDRAYVADGEVFLTGRVKDIVIRGGRCPMVRDCFPVSTSGAMPGTSSSHPLFMNLGINTSGKLPRGRRNPPRFRHGRWNYSRKPLPLSPSCMGTPNKMGCHVAPRKDSETMLPPR